MPRITTICPSCGVVILDGDDVTLVVDPSRRTAWYLFDCLGCARQVVRAAEGAVMTALANLRIATVTVPAEASDPARHHGAPLTVDDLLDLLLALRTDGAGRITMAGALTR